MNRESSKVAHGPIRCRIPYFIPGLARRDMKGCPGRDGFIRSQVAGGDVGGKGFVAVCESIGADRRRRDGVAVNRAEGGASFECLFANTGDLGAEADDGKRCAAFEGACFDRGQFCREVDGLKGRVIREYTGIDSGNAVRDGGHCKPRRSESQHVIILNKISVVSRGKCSIKALKGCTAFEGALPDRHHIARNRDFFKAGAALEGIFLNTLQCAREHYMLQRSAALEIRNPFSFEEISNI